MGASVDSCWSVHKQLTLTRITTVGAVICSMLPPCTLHCRSELTFMSWWTCSPAGPDCFLGGRHQCIRSKGSSPQGARRAGAGHARQAVLVAGGTSLQQRPSWGWYCSQFSSCCCRREQASAGGWELPQRSGHPGGPQQSSGGSIPEVIVAVSCTSTAERSDACLAAVGIVALGLQ